MAMLPTLFDEWLADKDLSKIDKRKLEPGEFYTWIEGFNRQYVDFNSASSPQDDVERWFIRYTNQVSKY